MKIPFFVCLTFLIMGLSFADSGIQVLYTFESTEGNIIKDRSGVQPPLNLKISDLKNVRRKTGVLEIKKGVKISSQKPADKIIAAVKKSGELSIEAWIVPLNIKQKGPARIVSLSKDSVNRNFTLGQDSGKYDVRLRTETTDKNGLPSVNSGGVNTKLSHIVYTREKSGKSKIYINGKKVKETQVKGKVAWSGSFKFILGNEHTGDRPWLGTYRLVAVYSKSLTEKQIKKYYSEGPARKILPPDPKIRSRHLFDTQVAAILSKHCLECHDTVAAKGDLDLSFAASAFKGGEEGPGIVRGKSSHSSVWESLLEDDMPKKRKPLSREEKQAVKEWIDTGAVWSVKRIDPLLYTGKRQASQNWVRRLTVAEYINTVRDTVGVDISREARKLLPKDLRADGFSNTAYNLNIDLKHIDAYSKLAELVVSRMDVLKFSQSYGGKAEFKNAFNNHITLMGKWILRGPLQKGEIESYKDVVDTVSSSKGTVKEAMSYVLEAMLQSPKFIYRMEDQHSGKLSQYELASRLSYATWGSRPDKELLEAAENEELKAGGIELQMRRMLADNRAAVWSKSFAYEWLHLSRLDNLNPDRNKYPNWKPDLAEDMKEETLAFFNDVIWNQNKSVSKLLNAQVTFLTGDLAVHYGIKPKGKGIQKYDLSSVPERGGILTQGSLLTVGGDEASMVTRGLFVLHDLLRGKVNDPPASADTTPVPIKEGLSQRSISLDRIANKSCGGCHSKFEPLSFGLEKFDGLGAFMETDRRGNKLRDDGEMLIPGEKEPVVYKSSAEMMDKLAASKRIKETITAKLIQFALGRPLVAQDAPILEEIYSEIHKNGSTWQNIMVAIARSKLMTGMRRLENE